MCIDEARLLFGVCVRVYFIDAMAMNIQFDMVCPQHHTARIYWIDTDLPIVLRWTEYHQTRTKLENKQQHSVKGYIK